MAAPRISSEDTSSDETIVGPAISIYGRIEGQEDLRVEGRIEGAVSLTETLYVEPSGLVFAEVEARDVVVSGIIIGNVSAQNSVTLNKGAKLVGNIQAPRLIIADGAAFRGDVVMDGDEAPTSRERSRATATVPRATISASRGSATRGRTVSGSYETRTTSVAPPRRETPAAAAPAPRPARATRRSADSDDDTVVIKHAALRKGEAPPEDDEPKTRRRAKKSARMPARGRRKAGRRGSS